VENLISLVELNEELKTDETGLWKRLPWGMGVGFGVLMGLFSVYESRHDSIGKMLAAGLGTALFTGPIYGILMGWGMRRLSHVMNRRIIEADPALVGDIGSAAEFRYRLPASLLKSPYRAVGGILYLGRPGILFQPHKRNRAVDLPAITLGPLSGLELATAPAALNPVSRLLTRQAPTTLRVRGPGGEHVFLVPAPSRIIPLLRSKIAEIQGG
jgi:hypothetical protein